MIVWETADDAKRYRESNLIHEPMTMEAELGLSSTRDGFAVTQQLRDLPLATARELDLGVAAATEPFDAHR